eukprot:COSAG02_NODE_43859_length_371_cov_0.750000_1_plen_58_part_01
MPSNAPFADSSGKTVETYGKEGMSTMCQCSTFIFEYAIASICACSSATGRKCRPVYVS